MNLFTETLIEKRLPISGNQYFQLLLEERGYTAETFVATYNATHPERKISVSTVQSWSCGRRSFCNTAASTVFKVAHVLEDPDCSYSDRERYEDTAWKLVHGCIVKN